MVGEWVRGIAWGVRTVGETQAPRNHPSLSVSRIRFTLVMPLLARAMEWTQTSGLSLPRCFPYPITMSSKFWSRDAGAAHQPGLAPGRIPTSAHCRTLLSAWRWIVGGALGGALAWNHAVAVTAPRLELQGVGGGRFELSWPSGDTGFQLEESGALGSAAHWRTVTVVPVERLGRWVAEVTAGTGARFYRLRDGGSVVVTGILDTSPGQEERGVAVTRESIFYLDGPLAAEVVLGPNDLVAEFGGRRLLTRADLSTDRRKLTLFYLENLPSGARIQVTLDGTDLEDARGVALDADGDGVPGGRRILRFDTFGATALPKTAVEGHVYASEKNADGSNRPLRNVTITVDGAEETLRTVTDATGYFQLFPSPAGRFFVHVDGRTADGSQWPGGAYYPFVGKAWEAVAGRTNNLAGGTGEIFLPRVQEDALRTVSATEATKIGPSPSALAARPELAGLELTLPPNALFSDNGARGGRVGIAAVPPDRLPEPLPPGLNLPIAVTIQTDGALNFEVPVPVRFPNLPDPLTGEKLPPGAKTVLWSFNHDTGRWEPQGTMTISADGAFADPDPGVGVRQPGWAGTGPGSPVFGPNRPGRGGGGGGGGFMGGSGGGGGGGEGPDDDCTQQIVCSIPQPERRWLNCLLKCARDVLEHPFTRPSPKRSPVETGLRCIGGPDKCPGKPDETVTPDQRACMDGCQQPEPLYVSYFVPCEGGYIHPCPEPGAEAELAAAQHSAGLALQSVAVSADADLLPDRLVEQRRFLEVEADYLVKLSGTPKFVQMEAAELPKLWNFVDALADRVQSGSPGGIHLSAEERTFLVNLPRPSQFSAAEWAAMVDRFDSLQGVPRPPEVAAAEKRWDDLVALLKSRGWTRRLDGFVHGYARLSAARAPDRSGGDFPARAHYYVLRNLDDAVEMRGRLNASGYFGALVLAPDKVHTIAYFDPVTGKAGGALFVSGPNGSATTIPSAPFEEFEATDADTDGDGLRDLAEDILGTDPTLADSDQDGIPDGAEVLNDGNPLDGISETFGYQAGLPLSQGARELVVENDVAVVRADQGGLAFVDLQQPLQPTLVGRFPIADPSLSLAAMWPYAVVGGSTRSTLVDFRDPANPREVWSKDQRGYAAALAFGRVYLAGDDALVAYDLDSGLPVESVRHPFRVLHARLLGDTLVTVTEASPRTLELLRLTQGGDQLQRLGGLDIDTDCYACGFGLFAEPGYAYYSTVRGYEVADIRNPAVIKRLARQGTDNVGAGPIEKDSGNRLIVSTFAAAFGIGEAALYDAANPTISSNFLTALSGLSAGMTDYVFHRGRLVCSVEDANTPGRGFVEIHGYRSRDRGTNAPTLALRAFTLQETPLAEQSLGWFRLSPRAADDGAVRNVEFYLDDALVANAGSHPFEVSLRAPERTAVRTQFVVRARAFDTAGNSRWSDPLTIALVPEIRPPRLLDFTPAAGIAGLTGTVFQVTARFTESLAPASLAGGWQVSEAGADGTFGTADDAPVSGSATLIAGEGFRYQLQLPQPLPRGSYRVSATTNLTDPFGNRLLNPTNWTFLIREPLAWKAGSGEWASAANWSEGRVPTATDFVRLEVPGEVEVSLRSSGGNELQAYQLRANEGVNFAGGTTFSMVTEAIFNGAVKFGETTGSTEVNLTGGTAIFRNSLEVLAAVTLRDHAWSLDAPGRVARFAEAGLTLMTYVQGRGSRLTIQPGSEAVVEVPANGISTWNLADAASGLENLGTLGKRGAGTLRFTGPGTFRNQGRLVVEQGSVEAGAVVLENYGRIEIQPGATFRSGRIFPPTRHARTGLTLGAGTNWITGAAIYEGEYTFAGTTIVDGDAKEFRGGIRSAGPWRVSGNGMTVRGLVADFAGPLYLGGVDGSGLARAQFLTSGETVLRDIRSLNAQLVGSGRLRVVSPLVISNQVAFTPGSAPWQIRFEGPLTLAGRSAGNAFLRAAGPGLQVVFAGRSDWTTGPVELSTNAVVAPGALFVVEGDELTEMRGAANVAGLRVQGVYRKSGAGTNRVQRLLNDGGLVEIAGGKVQSLLNLDTEGYAQSGGELRLAGGALDLRFGNEASTQPGRMALSGGTLTGAGAITGDVVLSGGALRPGANSGAAAGVIEVTGEVGWQAGGSFAVTVGGAVAGTDHDQLRATACEFDGTLEITLANGYVPALGQEFVIATFNQRGARQFRQVTGLGIDATRKFQVVYEPKALKLRVVP